jgi:tryptophanyl-tRNA synthetase
MMSNEQQIDYGTFEATLERSNQLEEDLARYPMKYKVLTGDRPTGCLHIGHLFGSVQNRNKTIKKGNTLYHINGFKESISQTRE